MKSRKIPVILGPTASGKTAFSLLCAERLGGEIVSADSMQIYRGMNIGTAKPTAEERRGIPHHMMDLVDPTEIFTLADYLVAARSCIRDILARGRLPIVVGGTGLYLSSLMDHVELAEIRHDEKYREDLKQLAEREGNAVLKQMLAEIDPESAEILHDNDRKRIIRALEVYHETGHTMTEQKRLSRQNVGEFSFEPVGLNFFDRAMLYDRIDRRVDRMRESGLEQEVRTLVSAGKLRPDSTAGQAIGYKEFFPYFDGKDSLEAVYERLKQESRRYAKRQLTWFRRDQRISWIVTENGWTVSDADVWMKKLESSWEDT